jgi:hypothetical protein
MKGKAKEHNLTHERLREALDYDPVTGIFTWKISPARNIKAGTRAGKKAGNSGYGYIRIDNEEITLGRLALFYITGEWPERRVRFINDDKTDCRYENLTLFGGGYGEFDQNTREGRLAYLKAYRSSNPIKEKARALRQGFNLSFEQYKVMHDSQHGNCAICGLPEKQYRQGKLRALAVDHNHTTGKIRGLLCSDCNTGIGKLKEDLNVLQRAIDYLKKHSSDSSAEHPGSLAPQTGPADTARTMERNLVQEER